MIQFIFWSVILIANLSNTYETGTYLVNFSVLNDNKFINKVNNDIL